MARLRRIFWFGLAALFLFEAWLWESLGAALRRALAWPPIQRLRAGFEHFVSHLSPLASLAVFAIPLILLTPIKLAALFFLGHRQFVAGIGCLIAAKLIGFASGAYLFDLCRPQLLKMRLFARFYATLTRWRTLAEHFIAPYRAALREKLPPLRAYLRALRPDGKKSFVARLRARSRRWIAQKT
jgi:hypothetical protein